MTRGLDLNSARSGKKKRGEAWWKKGEEGRREKMKKEGSRRKREGEEGRGGSGNF